MAGMEACNAAKTAIYTQYGEIQKWVGERVAAADARPGSVRVSGPEGGGAPYAYCIEGAMVMRKFVTYVRGTRSFRM